MHLHRSFSSLVKVGVFFLGFFPLFFASFYAFFLSLDNEGHKMKKYAREERKLFFSQMFVSTRPEASCRRAKKCVRVTLDRGNVSHRSSEWPNEHEHPFQMQAFHNAEMREKSPILLGVAVRS